MSADTLNVLIVGSADTAKAIKKALKPHSYDYNFYRVGTRQELTEALAQPITGSVTPISTSAQPLRPEAQNWQLLISEMELVDFSANDILEIFEDLSLSLPIILITGTGSLNAALHCLEYDHCQLIQNDLPFLQILPVAINTLINRFKRINQQSQLEHELIESVEQYKDIFNNTGDLIQCIAPDGSFIYTNDTWHKAMGFTREELKSLKLTDVLHPESRHSCSKRFERLQSGRRLPTIDFKFLTKSGETLHLIGECGSIIKNGVVTSTRGMFRNVTETVRYEQALLESEARYQALYDLAPDIYTTINENGEILSINQTGADMLGYSREELLGKHATMIIDKADVERVIAHIGKVFLSGKDDEGIEYKMLRSDGSGLWVHQRVKLDEDAYDPRLLVVCRDITVRRELQKKLAFHATHDSLTKLINRRELENRLQRVLAETTDKDVHILCFLDLDEFKIINDTHGHAAGDELLRQVTSILRENIRSRDTLARLGGDEFVVLMEHCPLNAAIKLAEKLQKLIANFEFNWRAQCFSIGVSIGITRLFPGATVEQVVSAADVACYKAKQNGRNCIRIDENI